MKTCDYCKKDTSETVRQHQLHLGPQFDNQDGGHDFRQFMDLHDSCSMTVSVKMNKLLEGLGLPQGDRHSLRLVR